MRLIITLMFILLLCTYGNSQTVLFTENFEANSLPDSITHVGTGVWGKSSKLFSGGSLSDSLRIDVTGDSVVATTQSFSTTGNSFVMLYFNHICKIEFFDEGYIEVSNNNGTTWTQLTANEYQGLSQFATQGNKFSSGAYVDWAPGVAGNPSNAWWKPEVFDISLLVGNASNVKIRFVLRDAVPGSSMGDNYAWFIDNIKVIGAFSELNPPVIVMTPTIPQDTMYTTDPYLVKANITDFSGIDTAYVVYTVNIGLPDTIGMVEVTPGNYECSIPFFGFGRTIHYKLIAIDGSAAHNVAYDPITGTRMIFAKYSSGGTVTIGTGVTTSATMGPIYISGPTSTYLYSNHISLFTPAEVGYTGALSTISWEKTDAQGYNLNNATYRIFLKNTTATTVNSAVGTFATELVGATLVYENTTQNLPLAAGWMDFLLTNPNAFSYDGVSNLMVLVYFYRPGVPTGAVPWRYTPAAGKACTWSSAADPPTIVYGNGSRPNIMLTFVTPSNLPQDAGIGQIVYPTGGVIANSSFTVLAKVKNYGTDTLISATLNWTVDGVLQTPFNWTGALEQDSLSADINLGLLTLPLGVHEIKIWTDMPNGLPDMNYGNDTMAISFMACQSLLSGTYTIGGTNPDFADFSSAIIALDQCGINAPVTFNVAPGTYNEQIEVPFISGASAVNPVIFQAANGDSTSVVLQYNANSSSENYTVKFDGTQWVTFNKVSIKALNTNNGRVVELAGASKSITIKNCVLEGTINPTKSNNALRAVVFSDDDVDENNTILNNRIIAGEHGVFLKGAASNKEAGNLIEGNTFEEQTISAIELHHQHGVTVKANSVLTTNQVDNYTGISLIYSTGDLKVLSNNVVISSAISAQGITLTNCQSDSAAQGLVANNMVSIHIALLGANDMYPCGLFSNNNTYQRFLYNSVNMYGTSTQPSAAVRLHSSTSSTGINLQNNNLVNGNAGGAALNVVGMTTASFNSDYNNYFSTGSSLIYWSSTFSSLSGWQSFSGKDTHSFSIKPYFNSDIDLHTFNGMLNGLATPVTDVTTDIDGDLRDAVTPDPGADEFDPPAIDVVLLEIVSPVGGCQMTTTEPVILLLKNVGTDTIDSGLAVHFRFNGSPTVVSENVTTVIAPSDSLSYTFTATVNMDVYALGVADTFDFQAWTTLIGDFVPYNDSLEIVLESKFTPLSPVTTSPVLAVYGHPITLTATSPWFIQWYAHDTSTVALDTGAVFTTPPLFGTTTFWVDASSGASSSAGTFFMTEVCHYKTSIGAPVGGWPSYLTADDYIEVTGVPGSDLAGFTLEQWSTSALVSSHTFPAGTIMGPNGTAVIAVGQMGSSTPVPSSYYYHGNGTYTGSFSSTGVGTGRIIKGPGGAIVDAAVYGTFTFPAAAGVTAADWSGNTPAISSSGNRLVGPYTKDGTNWVNSTTSPQDPNVLNTGVSLPTPLGCPSVRIPVVVNTTSPPPADAGVKAIVNPQGSVPSGVPHQVLVAVKNFGTDTLSQVNVHWRMNGVLQDSVVWTGMLPQDSSEVVVLDTVVLAGGAYCIDSWTTMPNNLQDTVHGNDTATVCFNACMNGVYTVGPASSGTYDFNSFNGALSTLVASGICGHVVFDVHPGTYTEQLTIDEITGMDANNTVTFRGASNDSTLAILEFSATGTADNWTVRLNGADWFNFERLTIKANNITYGRVVEMMGGAMHNRFESNRLISAGTSASATGCIYDYNTLNHYNTYRNNYMEGGYYTMYIYGTSSSVWETGTIIEGNEIVGSYYYPMYIYYTDSTQIIGNYIHSGVGPYSYGISVYYTNNAYRIVGNRVEIVATAATACYGMRDYYCNYYSYNPNPTGYGLVANNMISIVGGTGAHYGLYAYYSNGTEYYYNSIHIENGSTTARALYQGNTASNTLGQTFINNIFSSAGGGYAAYFTTPAQVTVSDYNNFFSSASNLAYWGANYGTLAALQAASGKDVHSVSIAPPYNTPSDLHLANTILSAKALPLAAVTVDIDGDPRSLMPTIGADEIPLLGKDAGVIAIITPGILTNEGQTYPVEVTVANFGTDTIFSMMIEYDVNGGVPISMAFADTLLPTNTANVMLPSMISPAGNSVICARTSLSLDSNYFNDEHCKSFFGTPLYDATIMRIEGLESGCNIGLDTVSIWVQNLGVNAINSPSPNTVTVSYQVNSLPVVTENFTPVVLPTDSVLFHFATLADFTVTTLDDTFTVVTWIDLIGDNVSYNDSANIEIISLHVPAPPVVNDTTIPYGTSVTLFAQSADSVLWFAQDTATVELHSGAYYTTPVLYTNTTYWAQAGAGFGASSGPYVPGDNIAPLAVASASNCSTGPCSVFNDLDFGVCGTQLVWISTSSPPALTPHVDWIDFEWPAEVNIDGMQIHHANAAARFLTGATLYKWDNGAWVDFHTFSNLPMQCESMVPFPMVTTTKFRITSFQMTGSGQTSNPNFREIEVFEADATGCSSPRVPLVVTVSNQQACDLGVESILGPTSAVNMGSQEIVKIRIKNYGTSDQSNFPVSYRIGNMPVVTETVTATVSANGTYDYSFTVPANLSVGGNTYQFKAWTGISCDNTHQNDTAWKSVTNLLPNYCVSKATSASYSEISNVKLNTLDNTSNPSGAMYTNFTSTVLPTMLSPGVNYNMSITSSFAPSSSSNYNCWVKVWIDFNRDGTFDPVSEMILSQATTNNSLLTANITMPFIAATGNTVMRVSLQQTTTESTVTPCNTYTYGETEDYMVTIAPQAACDAGVIAVLQPGSTAASGAALPVELQFMNFGSDTIPAGALSIAYKLNTGNPVVVPYQYAMVPGQIETIVMPNVTLPMGNNALCVYTILACDSNAFNNEICKNVYGQFQTGLPFFDDFETSNMWYKPAASVNWQYGTPSANIINSAHSGSKVWATNLAGDYTNNADEYLYTPLINFSGLSGVDTISLSFYHWNAMAASDYGRLQYTINNGQTWANLGFLGDALGTNWYNAQSGGIHYFSLTNSGWMYSAFKLDPAVFNGQSDVQFRFHLYSNASGTANGWAIDDFKLSLPTVTNDIGVTAITAPVGDTAAGSSINAVVTITNFGTSPQYSVPIKLTLDGNAVSTEIWSGTLSPLSGTSSYNFVIPYTTPNASYTLCAETQLMGDVYAMNDEFCRTYGTLPAYHDVGISAIVAPIPDATGNICMHNAQLQPWYQYDVVVRIQNYGQNPQTAVPVKYSFYNGGTVYTDTWTGSLAPNAHVDFTLSNLFKPNNGIQQVCAETNLIGDAITANNKGCQAYTGVLCTGIEDQVTEGFVLLQNIPNPASGTTAIGYHIPRAGELNIGVVNIMGQLMHQESTAVVAGKHQTELNVRSFAAGVYYYYIEFEGQRLTKKLVVRH